MHPTFLILIGFIVLSHWPAGSSLVKTVEEISPAPAKVDVKTVARDEEIRKRLQSVLKE